MRTHRIKIIALTLFITLTGLAAGGLTALEITAEVLPSYGTAFGVVGGTNSQDQDWVFLFPAGPFPAVTIEPPLTFEIAGRLRAYQIGSFGTLLRVGWGDTFSERSVRLRIADSGELLAVADLGGGGGSFRTGHVVEPGDPFYAAYVLEADGVTARLYAGKTSDDALPVWTHTYFTPMAGGAWNDLRIGESFGPTFDVWEARLWSVAKTRGELEDLGDGPVLDAPSRPELIESWRFEESAGTMAFGELGRLDLDSGFLTPEWPGSQCTSVTTGPVVRDECSLRVLPLGEETPGRVWCVRESCPGLSDDECFALAPFHREANPSLDPSVCGDAQVAGDAGQLFDFDVTLYEGLFVVSSSSTVFGDPPPSGDSPPDGDDPDEAPVEPPPEDGDADGDDGDTGRGLGIVDEPRWVDGDLCVDLEISRGAGVSVSAEISAPFIRHWSAGDDDVLEPGFRLVFTGVNRAGRETWSVWWAVGSQDLHYSVELYNVSLERVATFAMGTPQPGVSECAAAP